MEKVICIEVEPFGIIKVAKNYNQAIGWLIKNRYLNNFSYFWQRQKQDFETLPQMFGKNWQEKIFKFSIEEFNSLFYGNYCLLESEVV